MKEGASRAVIDYEKAAKLGQGGWVKAYKVRQLQTTDPLHEE